MRVGFFCLPRFQARNLSRLFIVRKNMNDLIDIDSSGPTLTMTSRSVAEVTGKRHADVIRDIRAMLKALKITDADLRHEEIQGVTQEKDERGYTSLFTLDEEMTLTLTSGYSVVQRNAIIKRWRQLEKSSATLDRDMILERLAALEERSKLEILDTGTPPPGFISRDRAHVFYRDGFGSKMFETVLDRMGVTVTHYKCRGEKGAYSTFAWKEDEIKPAIDEFLEDADQVSPQMCKSFTLLPGRKFMQDKEAVKKRREAEAARNQND